jgi:hypothetical protein
MRRTRVHLAVAVTMFALGLGIAVYLLLVLGRWQGLHCLTLPPFPALT